jgi:hypothetical protein
MKLDTPVGILAAGGSSPNWTFNLLFQDGNDAKFLRVGDRITSGVSGNRYQIVTWTGNPSDFVSNTQVTATAVDADVIPPNDGGFNSLANTPGQVHPFPTAQDQGILGNISIFSGQNFEWTCEYAPTDNVEAAKAVVGDYIADVNGRSFILSFLDGTNRFNDPIRVTEVDEQIGLLIRFELQKLTLSANHQSEVQRVYIQLLQASVCSTVLTSMETHITT